MKLFRTKMGSTWSLLSYQSSLLESPVHKSIPKGEYYRNDDPHYTHSPRKDCKSFSLQHSTEKLSVRGYDNLCYFPNDDPGPILFDCNPCEEEETQESSLTDPKSDSDYDSNPDTLSIICKTTKNLRRSLSLRPGGSFPFRRKKKEIPPESRSINNQIIYSSVLKNYDINYYPSETKKIFCEEDIEQS
ncbi:uncharacterized protein [Lepeophtheirus salmonis]|uniref:uncharacterized protein n=1 Tax=Lepeophtheirus salmonis TaxID=72036 RepID=UPI001AEABE2B|nr:uncharacterized protein LOC121116183 [Lepeophtheirus salmonis]